MNGDTAGEEPAQDFAAWYAATAPQVLLTLRAVVTDDGLAEEATAEAFARAFARWSAVSAMSSPSGWVYVVALNQVRSWARRRRLERRYVERTAAEPASPPVESDDALWAAVRSLPPRARTAVALHYIADLSESETARVMKVSRGTVATTLHRARRTLAAVLGTEHEGARDEH